MRAGASSASVGASSARDGKQGKAALLSHMRQQSHSNHRRVPDLIYSPQTGAAGWRRGRGMRRPPPPLALTCRQRGSVECRPTQPPAAAARSASQRCVCGCV